MSSLGGYSKSHMLIQSPALCQRPRTQRRAPVVVRLGNVMCVDRRDPRLASSNDALSATEIRIDGEMYIDP